ncbi:sugar-binding protein [Acidisoma cladoniae]|jgi:ribose transport system substrate-binding protein|uniref:sugar-binding protein n=1 Tax=Acidisoma cladoniae TaxID=3040935 RepID=UPI00254EE699|nr:sugar-binding protein [Acidisoma sp. PAMC 29798]
MKKILLTTAAVMTMGLGLMSVGAMHARAAEKTFALVPKALGIPFYADAETGCEAEAAKIGAKCEFTGPSQLDDAAQISIMRDLITKHVAGISVAPNNPDSIKNVIAAALKAGIPVITFDSDAPTSKRIAFVGTNNASAGATAGDAFAKALPNGGTYAVLTGGLSAANLNDRISGFKSKLGASFKEVSGSPYSCNDDSNQAVQVIQDILSKYPHLDGIFYSGGWPMFAPAAYARALKSRKADIQSGKFVVVSFDTLLPQLKLLKEGYATTLVGQRPYAMGTGSIDELNTLTQGGTVPPITDTGTDVVSASNVDAFMAKK